MARTKGSKDKAPRKSGRHPERAANTSPSSPAPITTDGGNAVVATEAQRQALFNQHFKRYKAWIEDNEEHKKRRKSIVDLAKRECGRGIMRKFDVAIQLATPEGEAALRDEFNGLLEVARWQGAPLGTQFSFVDLKSTNWDAAYENGKLDSKNGITAKPPYDPSSDMYQRYMKGYHDSTAERLNVAIGPLEEVTTFAAPSISNFDDEADEI